MKKLIINILFLLLSTTIFGQKRTYIGIEFGPTFDNYQLADNGTGLYTEPSLYGPIYGVSIGHDISKVFTLETGYFVNSYGVGHGMKEGDLNLYWLYTDVSVHQIPIRLKNRFNLIKDKFGLVTTVGYTVAINRSFTDSSFSSNGTFNNVWTEFDSRTLKKTYGLLEMGIGLEYKLKNSTRLFLSGNYLSGINKVIETDVNYQIGNGPQQSGTVFSNGGYFGVTFGLNFSISKYL